MCPPIMQPRRRRPLGPNKGSERRLTCPAVVRLHALDDHLKPREAAQPSLAAKLGGLPDLEPLGDFLVSKKLRGSPAAGSLRALGEGGWWTQQRLFEEGFEDVSDP